MQTSLNTEFKDCTLVTVAHRLASIMRCDKILVLDAGRLVEYDSPARLLERGEGSFWSLVEESGDKASLYEMLSASA